MVVEASQLVNASLLCARHERQLADDLAWLAAHLDDLENYRLNRAYGHKTGGNSGSGVAPAPVRESLADLLYADDDQGYPGLQGVLYEWARTLKINLPSNAPLPRLVDRIGHHPNLTGQACTPVYAQLIHQLVRKLRRFLEPGGDVILLGACENPDCDGTMTSTTGDVTAECRKCGLRLPVSVIRARLVQSLLESSTVCTRLVLLEKARQLGLKVNKSTLRSWIRRGTLPQAGENQQSEPVYRFSDFYRLATGLDAGMDIWQIIQSITKGAGHEQ